MATIATSQSATHSNNDRYPGFRGGICRMPIRYRHRWHRDLLLQAALNPAIDEMMPLENEISDCLAFVVCQAGRRALVLGVHDGASVPKTDDQLPFLLVTRAITLVEPLSISARAVWAMRHHPVSAGDRIRILTGFERTTSVCLRDLASLVPGSAGGIEAVFAMACSGELAISLSDGIYPEMSVYRRRSRPDPS